MSRNMSLWAQIMFSFSKLCQITQLCSDSHLTESKFLIPGESAGQKGPRVPEAGEDNPETNELLWQGPDLSPQGADLQQSGGYISCSLCFYRSKPWAKHTVTNHPKLPLWDLSPLLLIEIDFLKKGNAHCQCLCHWQCGSKCGLALGIHFF